MNSAESLHLVMGLLVGGLGLFMLLGAWTEWDDKEGRGGSIVLLGMGLFLSWLGINHLLSAFGLVGP